METGRTTRASLAQDILYAAHGFKGDASDGYVANLLDNKYDVAKTIAIDWGITYVTDAYQHGVDIAQRVTATSTAAAISLVGLVASDLPQFAGG